MKQDHDKHRKLLAAIKDTSGDSAERQCCSTHFKTDATAHAAAEEETLYATMMTMSEESGTTPSIAVSEHKEID